MSCSRRSVLLGIAATTAAGLCGGCGINVDAPPSITGKLDENPASANYAKIAVSLAENPALLSSGGALIVTVPAGNRPFMVPSGGVLLLRRLRVAVVGDRVLSISDDGTLRAWSVLDGRRLALVDLALVDDCPSALAASPDGTVLVGTRAGWVGRWHLGTG